MDPSSYTPLFAFTIYFGLVVGVVIALIIHILKKTEPTTPTAEERAVREEERQRTMKEAWETGELLARGMERIIQGAKDGTVAIDLAETLRIRVDELEDRLSRLEDASGGHS